ncbi:hypothetical protein MPDQ_005180 [Monascus purpureus]|uniref:Uncharacterized protein n=1 Tax=Monascus purpureus TaxID=5098 RepID=A0A507QKW8_MONPU|nr:hypothetical protein MPDQ_005180 [Monascus purpureus]BDD54755.1 hypothetical protein MAP00_000346 [Monascus purpureus]
MRTGWLLLASLAGYALGLPTDLNRRGLTISAGADVDVSAVVTGFVSEKISVSSFAGLSANGCAGLEVAVLGAEATVVGVAVREEIKAWLLSAGVHIFDASIHAALIAWCEATEAAILSVDVIAGLALYTPFLAQIAAEASLVATVNGIVAIDHFIQGEVALAASAQAALLSFITSSSAAALDLQVKAALAVAAAGGVVATLDAEVKAALLAWVTAEACTLEASLKAAVIAWIHGVVAAEVAVVDALQVEAAKIVAAGELIIAEVTAAGALVASVQASLAAFLKTNLVLGVDAGILASLKLAAAGELATALSVEARLALIAWLQAPFCALTAELKSAVLLWLSFAAAAEKTALALTAVDVFAIKAFLASSAAAALSVEIRAALGALLAGESLASLAVEVRAALAALLGGAAGVVVPFGFEVLVWGWIGGVTLVGGAPTVVL